MTGFRVLAAGVLLGFLAGAAAADSFVFSADKVKSVLASGKEKTVLTGKARVKSDRITITADEIEISGKDYNLLVCRGTVVADDTEKGIHLEAPNLIYERGASLALLQGPSVLEDAKNRVVLKADWIQDDGDKGVTLAQVNVRILKKGLACRSEYAIYRREEHILELSGAPRVVKDGDEYRATRMIVNTESEEIRFEGSVSGTVHSTDKKADATKPGEANSVKGVDATAGTTAVPAPTAPPTLPPGSGSVQPVAPSGTTGKPGR
jgi:lipopolysaccharide export system protein LptA